MNSHGGMQLSVADGRQTFQVVDYATDDIRLALSRAVGGTTIDITLVGLGSRGDAWRAVAIESDEKSCKADTVDKACETTRDETASQTIHPRQ